MKTQQELAVKAIEAFKATGLHSRSGRAFPTEFKEAKQRAESFISALRLDIRASADTHLEIKFSSVTFRPQGWRGWKEFCLWVDKTEAALVKLSEGGEQ